MATEIPRVSLRTDFGWLKNRVLRSEGDIDGTQDLGPQAVRDPGVGSVGWLMSAKGLGIGGCGREAGAALGLRSRFFGCAEKLDEILAVAAEPTLRPDIADADSRAATVKQRPTSRRITPAEISVSQPWARALGWSGPGPGDQRVMRLSLEVRVLCLGAFSGGGGALHGLSGEMSGAVSSS